MQLLVSEIKVLVQLEHLQRRHSGEHFFTALVIVATILHELSEQFSGLWLYTEIHCEVKPCELLSI